MSIRKSNSLRYVNKKRMSALWDFSDLCDLDTKALAEKIDARLQVLCLDV